MPLKTITSFKFFIYYFNFTLQPKFPLFLLFPVPPLPSTPPLLFHFRYRWAGWLRAFTLKMRKCFLWELCLAEYNVSTKSSYPYYEDMLAKSYPMSPVLIYFAVAMIKNTMTKATYRRKGWFWACGSKRLESITLMADKPGSWSSKLRAPISSLTNRKQRTNWKWYMALESQFPPPVTYFLH